MKEEIKALIEYRLQEAKESREEAEILLKNGKTRGALNRVYYSMFYATLALLASKQLSASKHSGVIALFHREFVKPGIALFQRKWPSFLISLLTSGAKVTTGIL
ncbi:MAG TPA: hypothetical protein DD725_04545 [Deltaproteobacteria bacterium]|nr:hypothetical protein [Deltaproteobacteria bacterium]